jgi:antitoxin component of MazEF toxin-antitoxin module
MIRLKVRKLGKSLGIVLPREVISRLKAGEGQLIFLIEESGSGYRIMSHDQAVESKMAGAEEIMGRYRNALSVLGK